MKNTKNLKKVCFFFLSLVILSLNIGIIVSGVFAKEADVSPSAQGATYLSAQHTPDTYEPMRSNDDFSHGKTIVYSVIFGAIIGLIITLSYKSQLKTVRFQQRADDYIKEDSLVVTNSQDIYLYKKVDSVQKAQPRK